MKHLRATDQRQRPTQLVQSELLKFVCECRELECRRPVVLTLAEIEASLEARADAERVLLRRLTDCRVKLELTGHRLRDLTAQAADDERAIQRERDRADSAERRLAEMTSGRAKLHAKFEQEHAL